MSKKEIVLITILAIMLAVGLFAFGLLLHGKITSDYSLARSFPITAYILQKTEERAALELTSKTNIENWQKESTSYQIKSYPAWFTDFENGLIGDFYLKTMLWQKEGKTVRQEFRLFLIYRDASVYFADLSVFDESAIKRFKEYDLRNTNANLVKSGKPGLFWREDSPKFIYLPSRNLLRRAFEIFGMDRVFMAFAVVGIFLAVIFLAGQLRYQRMKEKLKLPSPLRSNITYKDIGGLGHAIERMKEIGMVVKYPELYGGAKGGMPRGYLLTGPPGTGKTLLVKALANEESIPVFTFKSTEFTDMFSGVGPSRMRDLFLQLRKNAPCIAFFDEGEAFAKDRRRAITSTGQDLSLTLTQLLSEIGGVEKENQGVVVIMATNLPELIDEALLRSGRIGTPIVFPRPGIKERREILEIHSRGRNFPEDKKGEWLDWLTRETSGFTGADIEAVLNRTSNLSVKRTIEKIEGAGSILKKSFFRKKARRPKEIRGLSEKISLPDIEQSLREKIESIRKDGEKNSFAGTLVSKEIRADHQSGHKITERAVRGRGFVTSVSIIPDREGYQQTFDLEDLILREKNLDDNKLRDILAVMGGGRAGEIYKSKSISLLGAEDFKRASHLVHAMVSEWGMSAKIRVGVLDQNEDERKLSEKALPEREWEIKDLMENRFHQKPLLVVQENSEAFKALAAELLEKEDLTAEEVNFILDKFELKNPKNGNNNH